MEDKEVKRGYWVSNIEIYPAPAIPEGKVVGYSCSFCGRRGENKELYCKCGAKMFVPETEFGWK